MLFTSLHHVTASSSTRRASTILGALPSLLLVLYSPQSAAQASRTRDTLEEVTVFGTRLEERRSYVAQGSTVAKSDTALKDVPFAVTAITRALIDDQRPLNVGEALRNVAGYQPQPGFGGLNSRPRIRGFIPPSMLKNGFRQANFVPDTDMAAIAQIEVLKGPASALYGRFEPGGVVNIVTKRPLAEAYAHAELTAGSDAYYRTSVDVGGPLVDERLMYRLNVAYENAESYRDFVDLRKGLIAPALEWRFSEATSVLFEAQATYRDGGFDRGYVVPSDATLGKSLLSLPVSRNLGEPTDETLYHGYSGSVIVEHRFSNSWQLRAGGFYSDTRLDDNFFTSGSPLMPDARTYNRRMLYATDDQTDYTLSVELAGRVQSAGIEHKLLFGMDGSEEEYVYDAQRVPINSPIDPFEPVYGQANYGPPTVLAFAGVNRYRAAGIFMQDEMVLTPRWRVLLGGRYDTTEGTSIVGGTPETRNQRTVEEFSPRAGVTFAITSAVSAYVSYSKSFVPEIGGTIVGGRMTDPSMGTQYEAGLKTEWLDGRLHATAALYDLEKTNIVAGDPDNPGFSIQVGEQQSRGAELELVASWVERWNVIASYAYNDAEITRDTNTSIVGNRIVNVPEHTVSFWSTYHLPLGPASIVEFGGGAFYVAERAVNNANLFVLPSYTRLDAMAAYEIDAWKLALNVQNLTDEKYFDSAGGVFHPMPPRQWFLSVGYRF
jgi:iron complex outermembrane recepter protein